MKLPKKNRQQQLIQAIEENPFVTDEQLANNFLVSVQTIRLDRMELNIPELRARIKGVAAKSYDHELKSLPMHEVIGEIIDIELDERAISIFDVGQEHVFERNGIARGHHLFAQANSLAVAVIDDELALTVHADVSFVEPVKVGDRVITKAIVTNVDTIKNRTHIKVTSTVDGKTVFVGQFVMYRTKGEQ